MSERMTLRPKVAMPHYTCVPHVAALGICDARPDLRILWPHDVCDAKTCERVIEMSARAGYDDYGTFCELTLEGTVELTDEVSQAIRARMESWEQAMRSRPRQAPLAPVLADYADAQALLGRDVLIAYPNGNPVCEGAFLGLDVWGRATVRLADGSETEFGPERYHILAPAR